MAEHARRRKRSYPKDQRNLDLHILPAWAARPFASISRGDVIELLEGLIANGKPTLCNRVQALISGIFNFGIDAGVVNANPAFRLKRRGVERTGTRVLSDEEVRLFWRRIGLPPSSQRVGLGLQLILLTGVRVSEAAGIARSELTHIDQPEKAAWIIPGNRTKNGRVHYVPLPSAARQIVLELLDQAKDRSPFLLWNRRRPSEPMRGTTLSNAMIRFGASLIGSGEVEKHWRSDPPSPHDLRRTLGTRLSSLGVPKEDREAVLNHTPGGVTSKHYDLYDRASEKRRALSTWDVALAAILTPAPNVIPLARRHT